MDSGSDWDSLSGDGPSIKTETERPIQKEKQKISNHAEKSPVKYNNSPFHNSQHTKNTADDNNEEDSFQSVELKDKSHLEKRQTNHSKTRYDQTKNKENLPYLKFQQETKTGHGLNSTRKNKSNVSRNQYRADKEQQNKNSFDEDTEDDVADNILENNNIIYGGSSYKEKSVILQDKHKKAVKETQLEISDRTVSLNRNKSQTAESLPPSMVDRTDEDKTDDGIVEKRYYYEKPYYDYYTISVEEHAVVPKIANRLEQYIRRGWQEMFGILQIILSIFIIFFLELLSFVCRIVLEKFLLGSIRILSDFFIKPLLSVLFNSLLQPVFILLWNIITSIRRLLQPVIGVINDLVEPLAKLLKSFRLFEYKNVERCAVKDV